MKNFRCVLLLLIVSLKIIGSEIMVADATSGAQLDSLRQIFINYSLKTGKSVTIKSMPVDKTLKLLKTKDLKMAIICRNDLSKNLGLKRFPYAAEALVLYMNVEKPAVNLSVNEVAKLLTAPKPTWSSLTGNLNDIHRMILKSTAPGGNLIEWLLKVKYPSPNIMVLQSTSEGMVLTSANPEALFFGRFLAERPPEVVPVKINGIMPNAQTVGQGKYPLTRIYELVYSPTAMDKELYELLKSRKFYDEIIDSGLFPLTAL